MYITSAMLSIIRLGVLALSIHVLGEQCIGMCCIVPLVALHASLAHRMSDRNTPTLDLNMCVVAH